MTLPRICIDKIRCFDPDIILKYREKFQALLNGATKSVRLEKLKGSKGQKATYSIRLSDVARALLQIEQVAGQARWLVSEILVHHEYDKAKSLKKGAAKQDWISSAGKVYSVEDFESAELTMDEQKSLMSDEEGKDDFQVAKVYRFQNQYIQLSEEQESSIHLPLPALVHGIAGAGKTLIAGTIIDEEMQVRDKRRILYVAPTPALAAAMQRNLEEKYPNCRHGKVSVTCRAFHELLPHAVVPDEAPFFNQWFDAYCLREKIKRNKLTSILKEKKQQIFNEFRVLSAYQRDRSYENYFSLGQRGSIFFTGTGAMARQ